MPLTRAHLAYLNGQDAITAAALSLARAHDFGPAHPVPLNQAFADLVAAVREFYGPAYGPQPCPWITP